MRFLRGQLAYHGGDLPKAIQQFTRASELEPRSLAAYALLAGAYMEVDDWAKQELALKEALRHQPVTAQDYLFLGKALA